MNLKARDLLCRGAQMYMGEIRREKAVAQPAGAGGKGSGGSDDDLLRPAMRTVSTRVAHPAR